MAQFGLFRYAYLKVLVTVLRFLVRIRDRRNPRIEDPAEWRQISIPSRDAGRSIEARVYGPEPQTPSRKLPVLVNFHGSGFVMPMLGTDHAFCARVARETGFLVLDVDYRKAPETPFPGPVEDVEDALRWLASDVQAAVLGADASQVALCGFSAGANLALVAASALRQGIRGLAVPLVVALYPVADLSIDPGAKTAPDPVSPLDPRLARLFNACYAPDPASRADPRVSPGRADPSSFPDAVVILTCAGDNLAPEAGDLAARIEAADGGRRSVVHRCLPGVPHGWDKTCREGTEGWAQREVAYSLVVETLRGVLRQS